MRIKFIPESNKKYYPSSSFSFCDIIIYNSKKKVKIMHYTLLKQLKKNETHTLYVCLCVCPSVRYNLHNNKTYIMKKKSSYISIKNEIRKCA